MKDPIENRIEELFQKGLSRKQTFQRLKGADNQKKLLFHLNNHSLPADRKRFQLTNLLLALVLTFVTTKKLIAIFAFGMMDITLLLSLIVPVVNIYVLREILRFRRLGYQFLVIISILSVAQPDNHQFLELSLHLLMAVGGGWLYLALFPQKDQIAQP